VRRRVFFAGDGDAVSVTADFAGLGAGVGSAAKTLASAIKPMAAARSRMCFIIVISGLSFKWGLFSSAEAWPTKTLLKSTSYSMLRQSSAGLKRISIKPKAEACSDFFYSSHAPHFG
jgi:hypothetical protein